MTLPPRKKGTAEEEEKRTSGMKDGFRHVLADRPSLAMVALIATGTVCIFPIFTIMMPLYVRLVLGLGADKLGIPHGRFGRRIGRRRHFSHQRPAGPTHSAHDGLRCGRRLRDLRAVASAAIQCRAGAHDCEFVSYFDEFRPREHDRAGTRAGLSARPRLGGVHAEFCRLDADCRTRHHEPLRFYWNAQSAGHRSHDLRYHRLVCAQPRPARMRGSGEACIAEAQSPPPVVATTV